MATYMKISGIDGDVTSTGHEKWIHVEDLNFGVTRDLSTEPGRSGNRESTKPKISSVKITKIIDPASPNLFLQSCGIGKAIDEVSIDMCNTGTEINPYMQYKLTNVMVSEYDVDTKHVDDASKKPLETIAFDFDQIEMKFIPYDETNRAGPPIPAGYDLKAAEKI